MQEELLFVTKSTNEWDDGASYVLELAQTLKAGVAMLMVIAGQSQNTYDEMMIAVALAEGGEPEMAREHLRLEQERRVRSLEAKNIQALRERCQESRVYFSYEVMAGDTISLIQGLLKKKPAISMVLLNHSLSRELDTRKLTKNITRPVVLITRQGKEG